MANHTIAHEVVFEAVAEEVFRRYGRADLCHSYASFALRNGETVLTIRAPAGAPRSGHDPCDGRARPASGTIVRRFTSKADLRSMHVTRLRAKNQLTLPASVVSAVGLKQGDVLHIATDQDRVIITAQELRDRGRTYTMSELLGAASGLYDSVDEIDAEVAAGRAE